MPIHQIYTPRLQAGQSASPQNANAMYIQSPPLARSPLAVWSTWTSLSHCQCCFVLHMLSVVYNISLFVSFIFNFIFAFSSLLGYLSRCPHISAYDSAVCRPFKNLAFAGWFNSQRTSSLYIHFHCWIIIFYAICINTVLWIYNHWISGSSVLGSPFLALI